MRGRLVRIGCGVAVLGMVATACGDSPFVIGVTLDARITSGDTAVFVGVTATFVALAVYDLGPGEPQTVAWALDDTTKARLEISAANRDARLTGLDTGTVRLYARVNTDFLDSVEVEIVRPGIVRWRRTLPAAAALHPALDDSGNVLVMDLNGNLWRFGAGGDTVMNVSSCISSFGPAVNPLTFAVTTTGTDCTRQHDSSGVVQWSAGFGEFDTAPAIAADGSAIALSHERDETAGVEAIVVTRLSTQGVPVWRDTLAASASENAPKSAPAVDTNGDIYVTWRTASTYHLTRLTGAGVHRWTIDLPDWARLTAPAIGVGRVAVGYNGGLAVYDTAAGGEVWSKTFSLPNNVSSPIIDRDGNVYVQTLEGLFSYAPDGTPRWAADTLAADAAGDANGVGAPTLLVNDDIVVNCGGAVCGVDGATGALQWRAAVSGVVGSAVITLNGQIFVTSTSSEVIALWGNVLPGFNGWPTEGGDQQRSRRRQ